MKIKKWQRTTLAALLLGAALGIGAGAVNAYFTSGEGTRNTFTTGQVKISLNEPSWKPQDGKNLVARETVKKDPRITNTGVNDAYVFMTVQVPVRTVTMYTDTGRKEDYPETTELFELKKKSGTGYETLSSQNSGNWVELTERTTPGTEDKSFTTYVYAYKVPLKKGETTEALFDAVRLKNVIEGYSEISHISTKDEYPVIVNGYAIQASDVYGADGTDVTKGGVSEADLLRMYDVYINQNGTNTGSMNLYTDPSTTFQDGNMLIPEIPEKTGYKSDGYWYDESGNKYAPRTAVPITDEIKKNGFSIHVNWEPIKYTVHFDANGGSGTMQDMELSYDEAKNLTANTFTNTTKFVGWSLSSTGSINFRDTAAVRNLTETDGDTITLYALWKSNRYQIIFDANGGYFGDDVSKTINSVSYNGKSIVKGIYVSPPTNQTADFLSWSTAKDTSGTDLTFTDTGIPDGDFSENTTAYAKWNYADVTYDANGGHFKNGSTANTVTYGVKHTESPYYKTVVHTRNLNAYGVKTGSYANNADATVIVTVPGASKLTIQAEYGGESTSYDWASIWEGSHPDYTAKDNYSTSKSEPKKLGGSHDKKDLEITGDSATFSFRTDGSGSGDGYGFYAVVTGLDESGNEIHQEATITPGNTSNTSQLTAENVKPVSVKNSDINARYETPVPEEDGFSFIGWAVTKKANLLDTDVGFKDIQDYDLGRPAKNITVYAVWKDTRQKYAVMVYGIGHDTLEDGSIGGLTFGPATGKSFVDSFTAHTVDKDTKVQPEKETLDEANLHHNVITGTDAGTDADGNAYRCIHYDNWNTIIYWNNIDPHVYDKCLTNNCTHSVNLAPSEKAKSVTFTGTAVQSTGDGVGMLFDVLEDDASSDTSGSNGTYKETYKYRNRQWNQNYSDTMNYAGSRIRAILNGNDNFTVASLAGSDVTKYTEDTCILSALPKNLQDAIGKKQVHYASSYRAYTSDNIVNDKLWLFSNVELYGDPSGHASGYNYSSEGTQYERLKNLSVTATGRYWNLISYRSASYDDLWWLRSLHDNYNYDASLVYVDGSLLSYSVDGHSYGVAPGFVLARK